MTMKVQGKIEVAVLYIMQTIVEECMYCYETFSDDSDDHILVLTWKKKGAQIYFITLMQWHILIEA